MPDSYQVQHVNGLTYDFLFDMAKKLADADAMMLVGGGQKGIEPLVMANGGTPYRAFLEGRVDGDKYALILRLTNMELKSIEQYNVNHKNLAIKLTITILTYGKKDYYRTQRAYPDEYPWPPRYLYPERSTASSGDSYL